MEEGRGRQGKAVIRLIPMNIDYYYKIIRFTFFTWTTSVDHFLLLSTCFVFLFGVFLFCTESDAISLLNGLGPCVAYLHAASLCDLSSGPCTDKWHPARTWMEPGRGSCFLARQSFGMFVVSYSLSYELQLNKTDYFITQLLLFWHREA